MFETSVHTSLDWRSRKGFCRRYGRCRKKIKRCAQLFNAPFDLNDDMPNSHYLQIHPPVFLYDTYMSTRGHPRTINRL